MKTSLAVSLLCWLLLLPVLAPAQAVLSSKELQWETDMSQGLAMAKSSGKPAILYFNTRKAIACRDMEQITFRDDKVVEELKEFVLIALDLSQNPNLRRSMKIIKAPTVIFRNSDGIELFRAVGYKPPSEFFNYLNAIPREETAAATPIYNPSLMALQQRDGTESHRFVFYAPQALNVNIAGDFNDWSQDLMPMTKDKSGWYWIDLNLDDGFYEYKYVADGEWYEDPRAEMKKANGYGGYNSVLQVGTPPTRPVINGPTVTFLYYNRDAAQVAISGNFTNWQQVPMFAKGDGNWGIQYKLPKGTYQYKFVVDGEWMADPGNFRAEMDSGQNVNSVFMIN